MVRPHLYLDTCVILDGILGRRQVSIQLLTQAKSEVESGTWVCSTSRWAIIELLDNLQEERYVDNLRMEGHLFSRIRNMLGNRRLNLSRFVKYIITNTTTKFWHPSGLRITRIKIRQR